MTGRYPADMPRFEPGFTLAGYRLEAKVGEGGMAVVYRARDERLHRLVALKILAPGLTADVEFRQRFIRESAAAARVDHPHIVPIYQAGDAGGVLFIAMRFVPGGDLRQVIETMKREGPLSAARVADIISPVASALDAAHSAGLVHRDVKPGNILVDTGPGRPDHMLLSDFGISKSVTTAGTPPGTGRFLGTAAYSAPEQIEERPVDGRADQYALACVTYELLTGETPFQRQNISGVLIAHLHDQVPSLTSRRPDLPFSSNDVLARALAKSPGERYPSCADFADALRQVFSLPHYLASSIILRRTQYQPPAKPSEPSAAERPADEAPKTPSSPEDATIILPRPGKPEAEAAAAAGPVAEPQVAAAAPPAPEAAGLGPPAAREPEAAASARDWRRRVPVVAGAAVVVGVAVMIPFMLKSPAPARPELSVSSPAGATSPVTPPRAVRIPLPASLSRLAISSVSFSPTGSTLAVAGALSTCLMDLATHDCAISLAGADAVTFGQHGTILADSDDNGVIQLWDTATGRQMLPAFTDPDTKGAVSAAFSPDGNPLAVGDQNGTTYLWDVAATNSAPRSLPDPGSKGVNAVAFSLDGTLLAVGDENGTTYVWNVATGRLVASLPDSGSNGVWSVAFSPDGKTLAAGDGNGHSYLWNVTTKKLINFLSDTDGEGVRSLAFSPNGTVLATGDHNGNTYLWRVRGKTLITSLPSTNDHGVDAVAFSRDGKTLITGNEDGAVDSWPVGALTSGD